LKLQQGQIWRTDSVYLRIVKLERLAVEYKAMNRPDTKNGRHYNVTKKEFCRLIKGASLVEQNSAAETEVNPLDELPPERLKRRGRIR